MSGHRFLLAVLALCLVWQLPGLKAQEVNQNITLNDLWRDFRFFPQTVQGFNFLNDGIHYTAMEQTESGRAVVEYNLVTGEPTQIVFHGSALNDYNENLQGRFNSYVFSPNEQYMLIATQRESIYRYSYTAVFYLYHRETGQIKPVHNGERIMVPNFCPKEEKLAYVHHNDLYILPFSGDGAVIRVTRDGLKNSIINGSSDWVYEEEFYLTRAHEWSADGSKLAFIRFDESEVKEFTMSMYTNDVYPEYVTFKYPKVGEDNAEVSVHIFDVASQKTTNIDFSEYSDFYIPRIQWTRDADKLCITYMNRHQNNLKLYLATATEGSKKMLYQEVNPYFIDIHNNLHFTNDGKHFLWTSEQSGFNHVYLYNMEGKQVNAVTSGEFDVTRLYGLDEAGGHVFFQAAKVSPLEREVYRVNIDGSGLLKLCNNTGTNSAQFSSTFDYFVLNHAGVSTPPRYDVADREGKVLRNILDNAEFKEGLQKFNISEPVFSVLQTEDDVELHAYTIYPPDFDPSRQYPLLLYCYGGPGSQTVKNDWLGMNYFWFQMLAQQGIIVVSVDNRGTGARGEQFKKMTYMQLGHYETLDQIASARLLAQRSYIDADRIGIFGWSYGGYLSSLALLKGADVFSSAIAVAPVTNWKWYDTIYTERYMRTYKENEEGYEQNSPNNFAHLLEGHYLLIHGMGDDNVHLQHSTEMANALIAAGKQFEWFAYPNRNHSIGGGKTRLHLYTLMTDFLMRSYGLKN